MFWWALGICLVVFLAADTLGWLLVTNRMARTEHAVMAVLQYVVAQHGDQLPPHAAALLPAIRKGNHHGR